MDTKILLMLLITATFAGIATSRPVDQPQTHARSLKPSDGRFLPCAGAPCSTTDTKVSVRKRRFILKKIFKCVLFGKCPGHKHHRHLHEAPPPPIPPPMLPPPPLPPVLPPPPLPQVLPPPMLPPQPDPIFAASLTVLPPPVVPPAFPPQEFLPRQTFR